MAMKLSNSQAFEDFFKETAGFVFRKDVRGNLVDVILPPYYTLISKTISYGLLRKIHFKDPLKNEFEFEF